MPRTPFDKDILGARPGSVAPSGQQWVIGHGRQELVVAEVGATIRSYSVAGEPVLAGFEADQWSHAGRGQVLAPWPNRLADGRFEFEGTVAQAPLNEPERANAIHGLVRWRPWQLEALAQNVLTVACTLYPSPGYPFLLGLRVEYRLGRLGLTITTSARNLGQESLPFGLGFHPYFTAGTEHVDTAVLELPATERLVLDARALPTGERHPVVGTEYDFTTARAIGPTAMDTAFGGLRRDGDRLAWASLSDPATGRGASIWVDDRFGYLMVFTGDNLSPDERRRAVALEPMTCPPNALRSGQDLIVLLPGQEWTGSWGIRPHSQPG